MAGYLVSTQEKVDAVVKAAQYEKVDPRRVELVSVNVPGRPHVLTYNAGDATGARCGRQGVDFST